jgi:hypothetical protein
MNTPNRNVEVVRKNERTKFKPKAWSHQDELKQAVGKTVKLYHLAEDGTAYSAGELVSADAFTLRVRHQQSVLTYFKHGIVAYEIEG